MRALRFARFGDPAEVLALADIPCPEPGAGEVLVQMDLRPINPADRLLVQGRYGRRPALPAVAGVEGIGRVIAHGRNVTEPDVGTRVVFWRVRGTWQQFVTAKASDVLVVRGAIEDAAAAQIIAGPFAASVLFGDATGHTAKGWLVQSAAGSSFAALLRELAGRAGWRTIDLVRRPEQAIELAASGVPHPFATDDPDLVAKVMALTGGRGVDAALDAVGGPTGTLLARLLGPQGVLVVHGVLDGRPIELHPGWLIAKSATVKGFWLESWLEAAWATDRNAIAAETLAAMAAGGLACPVDSFFDLADFRAALARAGEPGRRGKVLLSG